MFWLQDDEFDAEGSSELLLLAVVSHQARVFDEDLSNFPVGTLSAIRVALAVSWPRRFDFVFDALVVMKRPGLCGGSVRPGALHPAGSPSLSLSFNPPCAEGPPQ